MPEPALSKQARAAGNALRHAPREHAAKAWDFVVPGFIFVFCAVIVGLSLTFDKAPPIIVGKAMQPRSFPIFLAGVIAALNCVLIWQILREPSRESRREPMQTWLTMLLLGVFYLIASTLDFFLGIAVVMFLICLVWGERRIWLAAVLAVVLPLAVFFFFDLVLEVRFPRGLLTELYYGG